MNAVCYPAVLNKTTSSKPTLYSVSFGLEERDSLLVAS